MFNDFDTQIQSDELAAMIPYDIDCDDDEEYDDDDADCYCD